MTAAHFQKWVDQLHKGEQSKELETLVDSITQICEEAGKKSVSAKDLDDGLRKIAKGELARETLDVYLRCCPKGAFDADDNWWIRVKGQTISAYKGTLGNARETRIQLSPEEFQEFFDMVTHTYKELPARLHSVYHLHFTVAVFKHEKDVKAWKFDGITPVTHGDKQKEFDHLVEQIEKLHQRAMKEGRPLTWVDDPK